MTEPTEEELVDIPVDPTATRIRVDGVDYPATFAGLLDAQRTMLGDLHMISFIVHANVIKVRVGDEHGLVAVVELDLQSAPPAFVAMLRLCEIQMVPGVAIELEKAQSDFLERARVIHDNVRWSEEEAATLSPEG